MREEVFFSRWQCFPGVFSAMEISAGGKYPGKIGSRIFSLNISDFFRERKPTSTYCTYYQYSSVSKMLVLCS